MNVQKATFAGGCFWCTEAKFQSLKGVKAASSGYIGGAVENPTYAQVCNGKTGHAEAIELTFDANLITYNDLLLVFFKTHDPTSLNRQGNDEGTQYRSAIFYHNEEQRQQAQTMIKSLTDEHVFDSPIVTLIEPAEKFYTAEAYHQNYFNNNSDKLYCSFVIQPKLTKFSREFTEKIRPELL